MGDFAKMDMFFVVTTLAVLVFTVLGVYIFVHIRTILLDIRHIVHTVSSESDLVKKDIDELRENVKEEGAKVAHLVTFVQRLFTHAKKRAKSSLSKFKK